MFQLLRNAILGGEQKSPPVTEGEHLVVDRAQIVHLMVQACSNHVLFNVKFSGLESSFSTALLGIYDEHGFMVLDELTPEEGNGLLKIKQQAAVSGRLAGVLLSFTAELAEAREKNGVAYYKVAIPKTVIYRQQRRSPRLPTHGNGIPFHALRGKGNSQILKGYVSDISRKGVGVILIEDEISLLRGEILPSCIISLPGLGEITFSLEVSFSSRDQKGPITRVGGRFRDIDAKSLQRVRRQIDKMEKIQQRN